MAGSARQREEDHQERQLQPEPMPELQPVPLADGPPGPGTVLALQRSAGNAAVTQAIDPSVHPRDQLATPAADPQDGPISGALARAVRERGAPARKPPSLQLRSLLRKRAGLLARAVTTSGGEWSTDKYDLLKDKDQSGAPANAALGLRGLDIELRFKPVDPVDAELIGLTQSVQAFVNNAPNLTPAASTRAIKSGDAEAINTGAGETDEGTAIDRAAGYNNPIYPVKNQSSGSLADTDTAAGWGQHAYHYTDAAKAAKHQDGLLKDTPMRSGAQKDSRHIFETTALATKGTQTGTYYGSVRWGWRTDDKGVFTKLPLEKVSDGVPSSTFLKAAGIWNPGKSSTGKDNVDLPIPDVKVLTAPVNLDRGVPFVGLMLPAGTRLQVLREWHPPLLTGRVRVVDGPHTGTEGDIDPADWPQITDERA